MSSLIDTVKRIQGNINPTLVLTGILRTMFDVKIKLCVEVSLQLSQHFKGKLLTTIIPRDVKLAESPSFGRSAISYAPNSKGAIAYLALANELLRRG